MRTLQTTRTKAGRPQARPVCGACAGALLDVLERISAASLDALAADGGGDDNGGRGGIGSLCGGDGGRRGLV